MKFRRIETVEAYLFDGDNQALLEGKLQDHLGKHDLQVNLFNDRLFPAGNWLVLQPNGRWRVLSEAVLRRLYSPVTPGDAGVKSCFGCIHYGLVDSRGHCGIFDETVDSEVAEAADCTAYEVES